MSLKQHLRRDLNQLIEEHKSGIESAEDSLKALEQTDTDRANYRVYLRSLWEKEGGESTTTQHHGRLRDAIKKAEEEFRGRNKRNDVQADYSVEISLGNRRYQVPVKYWAEFKERP